MLIKIISDIHLDINLDFELPVSEKSKETILCLLGDIGDPSLVGYIHLIEKASKEYFKTILIAGNHEYYGKRRIYETKIKIKEIVEPFSNVHFLDDSCIVIDGIKFAGTTLWSSIKKEEKIPALININDFKLIPGMSIEMYDMLHRNSVYWLEKVINETTEPLIVLTHHAPLTEGTSHPKYANTNTNSVFASDLSALFRKPIIKWFFGHTHYKCNFVYNDINVISNPVGYPGELTDYDPEQVMN